MEGQDGSNKTKTNEVNSRGLTQKEEECLVGGLNTASAIISQQIGQKILLAIPWLGITATDNSPELVLENEERMKTCNRNLERRRLEAMRENGIDGVAALARLFSAIAVAENGATGEQVLNVLKSTGVVRSNEE